MKRWLVAFVIAGLALAGLVLPANAQVQTTLSISPASDDAATFGTWTITLNGTGYIANADVAIAFDGVNATPSPPPRTNGSGTFTAVITPARRTAGRYVVAASHNPCAPTASCPRSAQATFTAVPQVAVDPPCYQPSTTSAVVVGTAFARDSAASTSIDNVTATGPTDKNGNFAIPLSGLSPTGTEGVVASDRFQNAARATWSPCPPETTTTTSTTTTTPSTTTSTTIRTTGSTTTTTSTTIPTVVTIPPPTPGATLTVDPPLGPGGFVTKARGTGFPANQLIGLGWSPGIGLFVAQAGPDGTFEAQVLVMKRDILGPRTLVATSGAVSASTVFLVLPSTVHPSGKDVAQINRTRRFLNR